MMVELDPALIVCGFLACAMIYAGIACTYGWQYDRSSIITIDGKENGNVLNGTTIYTTTPLSYLQLHETHTYNVSISKQRLLPNPVWGDMITTAIEVK